MSRPQNPIVRLLEFAGPHKRLTIAGCALSALNAVLAIAMLVCVWFVVRDLVAVAPAWGEARQAPVYGAWALAFALAGLVVYFAALMCTHLAAFRTATNMRKAALEHLAKVPLGYFSVRSTGELRRVIEGSTGLTEGVLAHRIPDFVGALVTPVAYLVVMFVFDWVMGLVCLIPVLASAFCMFLMMGGGLGGKDGEGNSNAMQFMVNYQNALDKMNKAAVEYVRGIPVVKVFQQTVHSFRAFRESIVAYCDFATAYVKLCEGPQVAQLVAINATFFVLVPAGILLAGAAGDFGAFLTNFLFYVIFSALTTMMMSKIMYSSQAVTEAQDAVSRIDGILSAPLMAEVDPARAEAPRPRSCRASGTRARGGCSWAASTCGPSRRPSSWSAWPSCSRTTSCSSRACWTTSAPRGRRRRARRWRRPRTRRSATTSWRSCRRGSTPWWAPAACTSRAASASASRSRAPS